jgi:Phage tail assembly chaperone protein
MEIRTQDGQVMYEAEFRAYTLANGGPTWGTTTPEVLAELGASVVLEGAQASPTRYQTAYRNGVEEIDGKWYTKYSVVDMDDEAKTAKNAEQAKSVRTTRDEKLKDSDWTQVADAPVDKTVWATYRQELRDLTKQSGFPWEVTYPTQP